jgi:hypothetical protein
VSGVFRPDLLAVLHARVALPRRLQAARPHRRQQLAATLASVLPGRVAAALNTRGGHFAGIFILCNLLTGLLLSFIYHYSGIAPAARAPSRAPCGWCTCACWCYRA